MSDIQTVTDLSANPFTLLAAALMFTAGTRFLQEIKTPRGSKDDKQRNKRELESINAAISEINETSKEIIKTLGQVINQGTDQDDCEELLAKQLEAVFSVVTDIVREQRDINSHQSNVKVLEKLEKVIEKHSVLEILLNKMDNKL